MRIRDFIQAWWNHDYCQDCSELRIHGYLCYCQRVAEYREGIEEDEQVSGEPDIGIIDPYWDTPSLIGAGGHWYKFADDPEKYMHKDDLQEYIDRDMPL